MNNKLDLSGITLIDHTAMDEENWQDYSITIDPKDFVINDIVNDVNYDFGNLNVNYDHDLSGSLKLSGKNADIIINGKSLSDRITSIEQRLGIFQVNPELESEFVELQKLGEQYRALEKHLLEKKQVWEKLQGAEGD